MYSSKLDADVIESYYYDMNECDIHATSDALQEVVKEVEGLEKAQAQTNIDNNLREYGEKLQTDFPVPPFDVPCGFNYQGTKSFFA